MNNQYILIVKLESMREDVYLGTDREFLESLVDVTLPTLEYARLYKTHYPLTTLVRSWEKEKEEKDE